MTLRASAGGANGRTIPPLTTRLSISDDVRVGTKVWVIASLTVIVLVTAAIYRAAGNNVIDKSMSITGYAIFAWTLVVNARQVEESWSRLGPKPPGSWVVAVVHLTIFSLLYFVGLYVHRAYVGTDDSGLPHAERTRRYRRAKAWSLRQWGAALSVVVVLVLGLPDAPSWREFVSGISWIIPYFILIWIAMYVFARLLRLAGAEPDDVGENSLACASVLALLIWALPMSHRGLVVIGLHTAWAYLIVVPLLLLVVVFLVRVAVAIPAAKVGVISLAAAARQVIIGLLLLTLYLVPLMWNDIPAKHDLTDVTGYPIPFL